MNGLKKTGENFMKKFQEKFAGLKICRTFAIPKQKKRWW